METRLACWVRSFFFNDTATTEIYTLSLHDALPISFGGMSYNQAIKADHDFTVDNVDAALNAQHLDAIDRKSTRLNSSHSQISYAVFCLKKNNTSPPDTVYSRISSVKQPIPSSPQTP